MESKQGLVKMVRNEYFTKEMAVQYLHSHGHLQTLTAEIIQKLRTLDTAQLGSILPQLIAVLFNKRVPGLEDFLYGLCGVSMSSYLLVKQGVESYGAAFVRRERAYLERLRYNIERSWVNKRLDFENLSQAELQNQLARQFAEKEYRFNYAESLRTFYRRLIAAERALKKDSSISDRRGYICSLVRYLNGELESIRAQAKDYRYYLGWVIPLPSCARETVIVNIIEEQTQLFETKERVPYKLCFETLALSQEILEVPGGEAESPGPPEWPQIEPEAEEVRTPQEARFDQLEKYIGELEHSSEKNTTTSGGAGLRELEEGTRLCFEHSQFGELWHVRKRRITMNSSFSKYKSYELRSFMLKGNDDLRQQFVTMQLIRKIKAMLEEARVEVKIRTYDIIVLSDSAGLIEFLGDTRSVDSLKKASHGSPLLAIYRHNFGLNLDEALDNFTRSLAGCSLLQHLLMIKDRHNGNILVDSEGSLVHIDFGFVLGQSPGGLNFESSPFKLTAEYVDMLGGKKGPLYQLFERLFLDGLKAVRKHSQDLLSSLELLLQNCEIESMKRVRMEEVRKRFKVSATDKEVEELGLRLIKDSYKNKRTVQYDLFQQITNNIRS